jgi:uracil-DNA glycosylase
MPIKTSVKSTAPDLFTDTLFENVDETPAPVENAPTGYPPAFLAPDECAPKVVFKSEWQDAQNVEELRQRMCGCINCKLGSTRTRLVFGVGNPNADILIIGEAPGADEDASGEPFVGRAGQLLNKILEAIQLQREDVFIANILKCRPPENRRPEADEVAACEGYLHKQIELVKPKFILALGLTAVDTLFKKKHKMGDIRGTLMDFRGTPLLTTYHPAALLRNPGWKKDVWEDVKYLRRLYDDVRGSVEKGGDIEPY